MEIKIIDAHTHVQFPEFDVDRKEVIRRALDAGIGMINVGTDEITSRKAVALAHTYEGGVWATAGIHPTELPTDVDWARTFVELEKLAQDERVVGIGECGLDYFRLEGEKAREQQKELFVEHVKLAHKVKKPLMLHIRTSNQKSEDAFTDILEIIHTHKSLINETPGICHFFTGTKKIAEKFLKRNFSFTFGGLVTYNREFDAVLEYIPADHMLIETDAPFVAPKSHRGHRNEPFFISETAEFLADFKKIPISMFLENTKRLFSL